MATILLLGLGLAARAAEPVVLLGSGPVVADGQAVSVTVWSPAIGPDTRLKVKGAGVKVGEIAVSEDLATITLTPAAVSQAGTFSLTLAGKGVQGEIAGEVSVPVAPPVSGAIALRFEPPLARVGVDSSVLVRISLPPGPQPVADRRLLLSASVGTVDSLAVQPDGSLVARWRPPAALDRSQVVLISAAEANAPDAVLGWAALPVMVRRSITVSAAPGTTNQLVVGDRTYGPFPASPAGTVAFDVELDPTRPGAVLKSTAKGATVDKPVDLAFGEAPVFSFAPLPATAAADAEGAFTVSLLALAPDGSPYKGAPPTIVASSGSVAAVSPGAAPGSFRALFTPAPKTTSVTFTATLGGVERKQTVALISGPASTSLSLSTNRLEAGQKDVGVTVFVKDATGSSITGAPPELVVDGLDKVGKIVDNKDGSYKIATKLKAGADSVLVLAAPQVKGAGNPAARLLLWAVDPDVGIGHPGYLVAVAVDRYGLPVADLPVSFSVPVGAGTVSAGGKTDARGIAWASYAGSMSAGPSTVRVSGAGLVEEAVIFTVAEGSAAPKIPAEADPVLERWKRAVGAQMVELPGVIKRPPVAPTPVAVATPAPTAVATPAAPSAPSASTPKAPKAPRSGGSSGEGGARLSVSLATAPRTYAMSADKPGNTLPPEASYSTGDAFGGDLFGGPGLDLRGVARFGETWGAEARLRYVSDPVEAGREEQTASGWEAVAGARYHGALADGISWFGAGGLHRMASHAFTYTDAAKVEVGLEPLTAVGARLGGGLLVEKGIVYAELAVAETLTPAPSNHHLGLELGVEVKPQIAVRAGLELEKRAFAGEIDGAALEIEESLQALMLGVTYTLR